MINNSCIIEVIREVTEDGQIYYRKNIKSIGLTRTELIGVLETLKLDLLYEMEKSLPELIKKLNVTDIPIVNIIEERIKNEERLKNAH